MAKFPKNSQNFSKYPKIPVHVEKFSISPQLSYMESWNFSTWQFFLHEYNSWYLWQIWALSQCYSNFKAWIWKYSIRNYDQNHIAEHFSVLQHCSQRFLEWITTKTSRKVPCHSWISYHAKLWTKWELFKGRYKWLLEGYATYFSEFCSQLDTLYM